MISSDMEQDILIAEITLVLNKLLPAGWSHQRVDRPFHGFINVLGGSLVCEFSDKDKITIPAEEILYLPKGSSYRLSAGGNEKLEYIIVNFRLERDDELLCSMLERHIVPQNSLKTAAKFRRLDELYFYTPIDYRVEMRACLYSILCGALSASRMHNFPGDERRLLPAIKYLREHFASECVLAEAANMCEMSVSHFRRLFHAYYCMTPKKYITVLRIATAKTLLTSTETPIYDIAEHCGFNDAAYFCKIFRSETWMTPNTYRKIGGIDNDV